MASIHYNRKTKCRRIQFMDGRGKRHSIYMGSTPAHQVLFVKSIVEDLLSAMLLRTTPRPSTIEWVRGLEDESLYEKLADHGLVPDRSGRTLGALLDRFEEVAAVKNSTKAAYKQTTDSLAEYFGLEKALTAISPFEAAAWRKAIAEPKPDPDNKNALPTILAPATVAKRTNVAKTIFRKAVKWGMLHSNPFADLRSGSQCNPARAFFVTPEMTKAILAEAPNHEWRAIIALCRYAGLRCPSEVLGVTWADCLWDRARLVVRSIKTEEHEGHEVRVVPIVPELHEILDAAYHAAPEGAVYIVGKYRDAKANLRTTFRKSIERAGLKPWPRLYHNLRASCASELAERFPAHVVAKWMGHSALIAQKHYLQTRDAHFELAAGDAFVRHAQTRAHQTAQQLSAEAENDEKREEIEPPDDAVQNSKNCPEITLASANCSSFPEENEQNLMGATGLEPVTSAM